MNTAVAAPAFAEARYAVLRGVLARWAARQATARVLEQLRDPRAFWAEERFGSRGRYAHELGESLLVQLQPAVEAACGRPLLPCYSFLRIYAPGASLFRHLDRPSCEYSVTLTLGFDAPALWPIIVERRGVPLAIKLDVGDMLVYKGSQVVHSRETFTGTYWVQLFMHYVDAEGLYTGFKFDGRDALGPFDPDRDQRPHLPPPPTPQPTDPCPCLSDKPYGECHGRADAAALPGTADTEARAG